MKPRILVSTIVLFLLAIFFLSSCQSPEVTSAKVYLQQNNLEAAKEQLMLAIDKEPMNPEVPFLLAVRIFIPQKEWLKAKQYLEKAKKIDPAYIFADGLKAEDHLNRLWSQIHSQGANKFNEALKAILPVEKDSLLVQAANQFKFSLEIKGDAIESYNALTKCYYMLDDTVNITATAEEVLEKGLYDEDIVLYYTQVLFNGGAEEKALSVLNSVLSDHYDSVKLQEIRIQFLAQLQRLDEAKEIARKLAEDYPTDVDIKYLLAQIYYKLGDYESAQYQFQQVLIESPDDIQVLYSIANSAFQAGDWIMSEDYARRMIDLDSESANGYQILWKSLYNQGKRDEAEEYRQIEKSLR